MFQVLLCIFDVLLQHGVLFHALVVLKEQCGKLSLGELNFSASFTQRGCYLVDGLTMVLCTWSTVAFMLHERTLTFEICVQGMAQHSNII
eukprot:m.226428 g.226428  ORF g.226428 m.226428 type:complete len:90 (-) comp15169_c0_seq20:843-1112(-)